MHHHASLQRHHDGLRRRWPRPLEWIATGPGAWNLLIQSLSLLGIVVAGIGGVIIAHLWRNGLTLEPNPRAALGGWVITIVVAAIVNVCPSQLSVALIAMLVGLVRIGCWMLRAPHVR